jgi:hypothetical protein
MELSALAAQLRNRLLDQGLVKASTLRRIPDSVIIDSYITCSGCGKRLVESAEVLARIIDQADSAETFLELRDTHGQHKH